MEAVSDVEEYLISLLGEGACRKFLSELLVRWKPAAEYPQCHLRHSRQHVRELGVWDEVTQSNCWNFTSLQSSKWIRVAFKSIALKYSPGIFLLR